MGWRQYQHDLKSLIWSIFDRKETKSAVNIPLLFLAYSLMLLESKFQSVLKWCFFQTLPSTYKLFLRLDANQAHSQATLERTRAEARGLGNNIYEVHQEHNGNIPDTWENHLMCTKRLFEPGIYSWELQQFNICSNQKDCSPGPICEDISEIFPLSSQEIF